jgi:hypothetical protein
MRVRVLPSPVTVSLQPTRLSDDPIIRFIELEVDCGFLIGFLPGDRIAWIRGNEFVCRTISQH